MTVRRNAYQTQRDATIRTVRATIDVTAHWMHVASRFADWLTWLSAHESTSDRPSQIIEALGSPERSYNAWATAQELAVTASELALLELVEDGSRTSLRAEAAYLLGWAAALSYVQRLKDSRGFSAPYELVGMLDNFGAGYAGIADALLTVSDENWQHLKHEVRQGLEQTTPGMLEDMPSRFPPLDNAKRLWDDAIAAEQAINHHILDVPGLSALPRILEDVGRRDIDFFASALDSTAGPWVTWPCLYDIKTDVLIELLKRADDCYQSDGTWTRKSAARLILHRLELNMRLSWDEDEATSTSDPDNRAEEIAATASAVCRALEGNVGGQLLLLHWAAHLLMEATSAESSVFKNRRSEGHEHFYYAVLNGLIDDVGGQAWTAVDKVRTGFPVGSISSESGTSIGPAWIDQMGRTDLAVPLACAVAFQLYDRAQHAPLPELDQWLLNVTASLRDTPSAYYLASESANLLTRPLGWPLFIASNSAQLLRKIWQQLALTRVEACYRRDYNSSSATEVCSSVANIALEAMSWGAALPPNGRAVDSFAIEVANVSDELRYLVPSVGLKSWSTTISRLVGVMATTGRLGSHHVLHTFFGRYVSDIDALALASASAIANGIDSGLLEVALASAGVSALEMTRDYCSWHFERKKSNPNKVTEILQTAYGV